MPKLLVISTQNPFRGEAVRRLPSAGDYSISPTYQQVPQASRWGVDPTQLVLSCGQREIARRLAQQRVVIAAKTQDSIFMARDISLCGLDPDMR